jgi:tetratricopeptide (TPR) repeat protein
VAAGGLAVGAALVLLAGVPPFVDPPWFSAGFVLRGLCLAVLTGVALLVAWNGPSVRPAPGPLALTLLAGPLAVGLLGLPAFDDTWSGAARAGATWALPTLLGGALLWTWSGAQDAHRTWRALALAGAVAAALAVLQRVLGRPAVSVFGRAGVAGPTLAALAGPALVQGARRWRRGGLVAGVLCAAGCVATGSRVGMVALVLGVLAAWAAGGASPRLRRWGRLALAGAAVLAALGLGLLASGRFPGVPAPRTLQVRLGIYRSALDAVAAAPARGHGLGSFPTAALRHRDLAEARLQPRRRAYQAHDDYLHASVEGGVPAGVVLALSLLGLAGAALLAGAGDPPAEVRRARGAAAGALVALGVAALGDGVLVDPAPALLLGTAAASALVARRPPRPAGPLSQVPLLLGALLAVGLAIVLGRDALADHDLTAYHDAIRYGVSERGAERAARRYLAEGALRWRPGDPEALYRLAVEQAREDHPARAKQTYRAALAADPGMTEARLDLAQIDLLQGRRQDARDVLREALRHDPTRYDVPRALMHLALGPEPVPGDPPAPVDEVEVLRWMNAARTLAPDRFENRVDEACFARRTAHSRADLERAGALLRQALRVAPGGPSHPPAEILLESFHLAEAQGTATPLERASILLQALATNPRPAGRYRAQAARFLDEGVRRVADALRRAGEDPARLDWRAADRAFLAAAVRLTALLYAGQEDPETVLAGARADKEAGRWRRALAQYRSLLAWTLPAQGGVSALHGPARLEAIARQGDLLLEAASVAQRVDRGLATLYRTRGELRLGVELLEKGHPDLARRKLEAALASDPDLADAHFALARVLVALGREDDAVKQLRVALETKPALREPALDAPDLEALRARPAVRALLGGP